MNIITVTSVFSLCPVLENLLNRFVLTWQLRLTVNHKFLPFFLFFTSNLSGQILQGEVIDVETSLPIPFANVSIIGTKKGTSTDIDGKFFLKIEIPAKVSITCIGYFSKEVNVTDDLVITIELKSKVEFLQGITIVPQINPAHRIIKLAQQSKNKNDPNHLNSYSFDSYNKLYATLTPDATVLKEDSALTHRMDSSELFISESVVEHQFQKSNKFHEHIIGQRTSGIKNPIFAAILTDFQPTSFYNDWIFLKLTDKHYLNFLHDEDFSNYDYELLDTIHQGIDSIFVISFEPQKNKNFEALKGFVHINSNGFAIENIQVESCNATDSFYFLLQQKYKLVDGHWFPFQLNSDIIVQDKGNVLYGVHYKHESYFSDVHINNANSIKIFPSTNRDIASDASHKSSTFWDDRRIYPLTTKQLNTYDYYNENPAKTLNTTFNIIEALLAGQIYTRRINIPINNLVAFNEYEGFRVGFGATTNEGLSKKIFLGGYVGYGLSDEALKYGGEIQFRSGNQYSSSIKLSYQNEVSEPASTIAVNNKEGTILKDGFRGLLTSRMDSISRLGISFTSFINPNSKFGLSILREEKKPAYNYSYTGKDGYVYETFATTEIGANFRCAVGEKRVNFGRGSFTTTNPTKLFEISISKGIGFYEKDLDLLRIRSLLEYRFNTRVGETSLHLMTGYAYGDLPYPYLFNGRGTSQSPMFFYLNNTFQTMSPYGFVTDKYLSLFISQNFGRLLLRSSKQYSIPEFIITHGVYWGTISGAEKHSLIEIKSPENGYYELGLITNKILRVRYLQTIFIDLGLGTFYRYGFYANPGFNDNFVLKIWLAASF